MNMKTKTCFMQGRNGVHRKTMQEAIVVTKHWSRNRHCRSKSPREGVMLGVRYKVCFEKWDGRNWRCKNS